MNTDRSILIHHKYKINKLKEKRILSGLSQKELSKRSGVPLKSIGNYEQGFRDINRARVDIVYRLARELNCTIEELITID